jgi:arylsulfatase A-like enzyme
MGKPSENPAGYAASEVTARLGRLKPDSLLLLHGMADDNVTFDNSTRVMADLQARGMLDDTLVVWGGEFGRTVYGQGGLQDDYGRDHHGRCYSVWMAGGGIRPGVVHGETDDYGYNVVRDPVHVHDLNATLLHCLGYDHKRLTYRFQGRDYRLTDVEGNVVKEILA